MSFAHLHTHTAFSLLDGEGTVKKTLDRAKELGQTAMAITDHGCMFGVIGIKPILGCEVYVAARTRHDKDHALDASSSHLILLAKNNIGYKNLMNIVSIGYIEGFYYKPRIDMEVLRENSEGIIALSACMIGVLSKKILANDYDGAKQSALEFIDIFGRENYYIEIQDHGIYEQKRLYSELIRLARELDLGIVATNDIHYVMREDAEYQDILMCIQTGKTVNDEDRMKMSTDAMYVKSEDEMRELFAYIPEAIENTMKIADMCNVEIEFGKLHLPRFDLPEGYTSESYLRKLCEDGFKKRYPNADEKLRARLEYEFGTIKQMGYVDYFLIVWDFIHFARQNGIMVGPGRGSAAGSIVSYCLEITNIDPIKFDLIFERFLNPERVTMPDIDIDFCYERRQEVIDYVSRKYGPDHVSQIITFGTMSARMVIRDVGRVLDVPYATADKLAKMVPNELHITIKKALEQNKEFKDEYENNPETKKLLDIAMALEGMPRQASTHACGIVITKDPVVTYVPLYVRDGMISTQYIMTTLEELGLLKMDFLGLRTLTVIQDTINLVKKNRGIDVKFDQGMNDPKVFKLWQDGNTMGIFQFESQGMTNFMKELKPDCLEDLIAGVSLYRPGPMDQIPRYISNKKDPDHAVYTHDSLKPILKVTYGCMVYQEQVMQIVRDLAGYSLGRADLVRRAMGKKKLEVMAKEREIFIHGQVDENGNIIVPGCVRNGIDEKSANKIFDEMSEFAKYAFNKSHAACYAVVSYRTAYLKAYYPTEFMAAMLNSFLGNLDKIPEYIDECKRMNIEILKPDINRSYTKFTVDGGKIRFGLGSIKNVGLAAVDTIVANREKNGEYISFTDFCERMEGEAVNKKCIESLIKAGAFDNFAETRSTLMASFEDIIDTISGASRKNIQGQVSMFDMAMSQTDSSKDDMEKLKYKYTTLKEYSDQELLSMEKEMLGIYVSGHPLEKYRELIEKFADVNTLQMRDASELVSTENEEDVSPEKLAGRVQQLKDGQFVKYAGIITGIKKKYTKNNKLMAFVTIEDLYGSVDVIVFENCYNQCSNELIDENIVLVEGRLSIREDEAPSIIARTIRNLEDVANNPSSTNISVNNENGANQAVKISKKRLNINITNLDEAQKDRLRGALKFFNGDRNNTQIEIINGEKIAPAGGLFVTPEILEEIQEIVGIENAVFEK